jgi:RND family efflux transporter MFP subunit
MSTRVVTKWVAKGILALLVLVGAPLVGMLLTRKSEAGEAPKDTLAKAEQAATARFTNDFVGVLLPPQMANLSPRADGKVLEQRAKAGQPVRAGDVIVAFDLRERQHDLAIAEAQLKVARAEAAGAGSDYMAAHKRAARRNASVDIGGGQRVALVSGEESAQAHFEAQSAGAKAASAAAHIAEQKAKVDQLRLALQESELRAPFDGIVSSVYFEPGMTAHTGDIVARIVGGQGLRARIAVPEEAASLLKSRHATITLDEKTLTATIDQVTPEAEPTTRAFVIEGNVDLSGAQAACGGVGCASLAGRPMRAVLTP